MGSKQLGFLLAVVMLVLVFDCGNCNYQQFRFLESIRTNIVKGLEDAESVLHRDSRSIHRRRRSILNSTEQPQALEDHNRLRRLEGASNMELMIWDNDLANAAERAVQNCTWNHSNSGQNLYSTDDQKPINLTAAIEAWYNEKPNYNNGTCQPSDKPCLHYSQVVWGPSRKLGCAYTRCPQLFLTTFTNALFLVCNYDPPGNIGGVKPYKNGVSCSQCASGSWYCNNKLCDERCTAPGPSCDCTLVCKNHGNLTGDTCSSCSCAPGWYGSDCGNACTLMCKNFGNLISDTCSCSCAPGWYGSDCGNACTLMCKNFGNLTSDTCSCSCAPGWYGSDCGNACTLMCKNYGNLTGDTCSCSCAPGWRGSDCGIAVSSASALLRNMMLVWLSWLLPYSLRSI